MTNTIRSHGTLDLTDGTIFGQNLSATIETSFLQQQIAVVGTGKPSQGVTPTTGVTQTLYLTQSGDTDAISVTDINQGQLGDCFLLSAFGEEALFHPNAITNMIQDNGNGTETVTLYLDQNGSLPGFGTTSFHATTVTVDNVFSSASVNSQPGQDAVGNLKEIWPQVVEKAVATLAGGYDAIANGGYAALAMETLTGKTATVFSPGQLSLASLQQYVAAGDLITFDTSSASGLPNNLVSSHCYMLQSVSGTGDNATVHLLNPWGYNQPAAVSFSQLAQSGIVGIDVGHAA